MSAEKKKVMRLLLIAVCLSSFSFFLHTQFVNAESVRTELSIALENVPPVLIKPIPDQIWAVNTNLTNAFDLDDYFIDNETLTYSVSSANGITITINETTNQVSFYPDYNFEGNRTVVFTAFDPFTSTDSNSVTLNVTEDNEAPTWSSLTKDQNQIVQNLVVAFSAIWKDNIGLSSYIFSIKQEGGWINQSASAFSGTQNTSSYSIQISAPGGTTVFWRFYGFDTSGNMNSTSIQNFTVSQSPAPPASEEDSEDISDDEEVAATSKAGSTKVTDFEVGPSESFKLDIKQGSAGRITIKITNIGNTDLEFNISTYGLKEFEHLISDTRFNLSGGEYKSIAIEFTSDKRIPPDIYYGGIKIIGNKMIRKMPVVIAVKALETDLKLDVNISEKYKKVKPGQIVRANITLENLKDIEERNASIYYAIMDFKGKVIDSGFEEFRLYERVVYFERELEIPKKIRKGEYIFFARVVSEKDIAIDSEVFEIGEKFSVSGFVRANLILLIILLSSLIMASFMVKHYKNKERIRLLNLYLMINEMNELIKEGKLDEAIEIYIRIKSAYGEPISKTAIENKEELKKEMKKLSQTLDADLISKNISEEKKNKGKKPQEKRGEDNKEEKKDRVKKTAEKKQDYGEGRIEVKKNKEQNERQGKNSIKPLSEKDAKTETAETSGKEQSADSEKEGKEENEKKKI